MFQLTYQDAIANFKQAQETLRLAEQHVIKTHRAFEEASGQLERVRDLVRQAADDVNMARSREMAKFWGGCAQ